MFLVYIVIGGVWAWFCFRHLHDLLPIQVSHESSLWNIAKHTLVLPFGPCGFVGY